MGLRFRLPYHWPSLLLLGVGSLVVIASLVAPGPTVPSIHMSVFAYRDINRNGVYDLEDRPYAGLQVTLHRPEGDPVEQASNIAGFANFDMTRNRRTGDIHSAGVHTIHVAAPASWLVTSGNSVQSITIMEREASATGLVADQTPDAVGLAPALEISGAVEVGLQDGKAAQISLRAHSPDGDTSSVAIAPDGSFRFPATTGVWRLELNHQGSELATRAVTVGEYPVVASRLADSGMPPTRSKPNVTTIGFDDLTISDTLYEIPKGYAGLDWRNWVATHQKLYAGAGYVNATISSEYLAYTSSGHPATISSITSFDFVGAYVGVAWPEAEQYDVVVKAWRGNHQTYEDRFRASVAGPVYFDADYRNISRLEFRSDGFWPITVDDLAIRTE